LILFESECCTPEPQVCCVQKIHEVRNTKSELVKEDDLELSKMRGYTRKKRFQVSAGIPKCKSGKVWECDSCHTWPKQHFPFDIAVGDGGVKVDGEGLSLRHL